MTVSGQLLVAVAPFLPSPPSRSSLLGQTAISDVDPLKSEYLSYQPTRIRLMATDEQINLAESHPVDPEKLIRPGKDLLHLPERTLFLAAE